MRRGRSQIIWRFSPGAVFRYGETGAWCEVTEVTLGNTRPLTGALAAALTSELYRWRAVGPAGFPDPRNAPHRYIVGEPYEVHYSLWPTVFQCRLCGKVHYYQLLAKLKEVNDRLRCRSCRIDGTLVQIPYAYIHECGRKESTRIPHHDITHDIQLIDRGSFADSFWRCHTCGRPLQTRAREGLGFRQCPGCHGKLQRGVLLEDSRVHYSHTLPLVEAESAALDHWKENDRFDDFLLAAVIGIDRYRRADLLDLARSKEALGVETPELRAMRRLLLESGTMSPEAVEDLVKQSLKQASADPWREYTDALRPMRDIAPAVSWRESRQTVEYVFVRDDPTMSTITLEELTRESRGTDNPTAERREQEIRLASSLGLLDLAVVEALPILLAGYGYTRQYQSPAIGSADGEDAGTAVALVPFPGKDGKIPILAASNTTEALLFRLDPWRMAAFLQRNLAMTIPDRVLATEATLRAWLLALAEPLLAHGESHLELTSWEVEQAVAVDPPSALMFAVQHTIAHVMKVTAHQYVGIDVDALAEYLFPAHLAGALYVSAHVSFTLGGIDSVFRSNLGQWLGSARDHAAVCSFDPICGDEGGACLACLYQKFGCAYFNRSLSRSLLFGGHLRGMGGIIAGFWGPEVAGAAEDLRSRGSATPSVP
jgi:Zn-finger nucleic acid-binding protein